MLLLLLLIPFISIIAIIGFRHNYAPTNEEIIEYIKKSKAYTSKAEYKIKNSKGEYKEDTNIYYCKDVGMRIEFGQDRIKIYKDGYISIQDKGGKYELEKDFDSLYPLSFVSNLLCGDIEEINEGAEEWGDIQYLEIKVNLSNINDHMTSAKIYINKEDKTPIVTKIYDKDGKNRVDIVYKEFNYLKEIDKNLF
ncbi:germination lipoprotein GerS-related protein [Clostridium sp.]|uniref:germination lipoprotein GerS-related protein n=1 Tax=Clostridium sp. TaxID=1506 RepID=UPI00290E6820|nr:germination lipoprotein GerS-related protein [Clostridium sp.]MDU3355930.1 germination lipoprotein GerS-related protein [Clostridium sp.]